MSYANASVLVTLDASSCEASLNTFENINTYEKSKMPRGIERKIKLNICVHTIGFIEKAIAFSSNHMLLS